MEHKYEDIRKYWEEKGLREGQSSQATLPDYNLRELEIELIKQNLHKNDICLDVGCGNGYSTYIFSKNVKEIIGIDYSKNLINAAKKSYNRKNLKFLHMDVLDLKFEEQYFDTIITERCLINFTSWKEQKKGILILKERLKMDGILIMCESYNNCLDKFNELREQFDLKPIKKHWHNVLFDEKSTLHFLKQNFQLVDIYGMGLYYFISRIIHPILVKPNEPKYEHPINTVALNIAKKLQNDELNEFSTNKVIILRKVDR